MSETTQTYLALETESEEIDNGFYTALNYIRENANTQYGKGRLFERLIRTYLLEDPFYQKRFSEVHLWSEWAALRPEFDGVDIGIDLVAQERDGGYCAIQCKCYAENRRISKKDLDTFISASARHPFTARMFVDTGSDWSANLHRTLDGLQPPCQRISAADLASRPVKWPDLSTETAEQLDYQQETFHIRPHQQEAFDAVINGFRDSDRGKLIMACGTGKTFAALRIAEEIAGIGGTVLYLVPSIGLFSQAMREWAEQQGVPHRYIGICSDTKAGKTAEDASILELEIPVTTEPAAISEALQKTDENSMKVVFCTYHSLPIVEAAQAAGAPPFDLILCDEAHRTTGIEDTNDKTSPFVLVHNAERIRATKRLYMTATSRLYTEGAKTKAARHDIEVFSMDDPETYGPEFHRLPFSRAVEQDLLSDYKVVVLAMSEQDADAALQTYQTAGGREISINDATKIVGCWRALQNPERKSPDDPDIRPLTRAIAFTNTIAASRNLVNHWNGVIQSAVEQMPEDQRPPNFNCETEHVDGKTNALARKKQIEWLKGNADGVCRILSNARCLSEGIDVPALDAVLFMSPRNSHVDIVQAVGRVMRKAEGKEYGYIVLPVAVPAGADPADILNDNKRFAGVWNVLRALRSHDDRLNAEINRIDLNTTPTNRVIFSGYGIQENNGNGDSARAHLNEQLFLPMDIPPDAIFAKIVEKCGDRKYWESWAKDVADIFLRVAGRIKGLLDSPENEALREWFDDFHGELKNAINDAITRENAIDMMAQHILTRPVFEALFEHYDFASGNPVAKALDKLQNDFGEFGLEDETRDLAKFYESVRMRARGIDNSEGRQRVLLELYEKFFATALKKDAERLGIVYTPVEVVDFILQSADEVLQAEFGKNLTDEGVHILDPFTGAGIFLARLLQSDLIHPTDLERKYRHELHANEIVLLAYYIAAINIEEAFRGRRSNSPPPAGGLGGVDTHSPTLADDPSNSPLEKGGKGGSNSPIEKENKGGSNSPLLADDPSNSPPPAGGLGGVDTNSPTDESSKAGYEPFNGIVLTDTFNLNTSETPTLFRKEWLPDNNERAERQQQFPIEVIIGNPPWSMGQRSAADNNPNVEYPELEQRIKETYAERSTGNNKNSLYDTYKQAIRWASDRIKTQGIIAFVTNGSWIDGNVDSGVRACLAEEFNSIYVLHLRGDARTSGERRRSEGGNVFGSGTRTPVAITLLVKNPNASTPLPASSNSPLEKGGEGGSNFSNFPPPAGGKGGVDCRIHYRDIGDYLTREDKLQALREAKSIKGFNAWQTITPNTHHDWIDQRNDAFTTFYPLGTKAAKAGGTDAAIFKLYSRGHGTGRDTYVYNFSRDACAQNAQRMTQDYLAALSELKANPQLTVGQVTQRHNSHIKWGGDLKKKIEQKRISEFNDHYIRKAMYRPFVAMNCYADNFFAQENMGTIFSHSNLVICVPGVGSKKAFSTLITDTTPDLGFNNACQCFPRWRYLNQTDTSHSPIELLNINGGG